VVKATEVDVVDPAENCADTLNVEPTKFLRAVFKAAWKVPTAEVLPVSVKVSEPEQPPAVGVHGVQFLTVWTQIVCSSVTSDVMLGVPKPTSRHVNV
jgi:hypothetical protein